LKEGLSESSNSREEEKAEAPVDIDAKILEYTGRESEATPPPNR